MELIRIDKNILGLFPALQSVCVLTCDRKKSYAQLPINDGVLLNIVSLLPSYWHILVWLVSLQSVSVRHLTGSKVVATIFVIVLFFSPCFSVICFAHRKTAQIKTSTTKVILEAQWGICSAQCVLRQYTVVFAWKCRLFLLCMPGKCRVHHIYYVAFYFWFRRLVSFPV